MNIGVLPCRAGILTSLEHVNAILVFEAAANNVTHNKIPTHFRDQQHRSANVRLY